MLIKFYYHLLLLLLLLLLFIFLSCFFGNLQSLMEKHFLGKSWANSELSRFNNHRLLFDKTQKRGKDCEEEHSPSPMPQANTLQQGRFRV